MFICLHSCFSNTFNISSFYLSTILVYKALRKHQIKWPPTKQTIAPSYVYPLYSDYSEAMSRASEPHLRVCMLNQAFIVNNSSYVPKTFKFFIEDEEICVCDFESIKVKKIMVGVLFT